MAFPASVNEVQLTRSKGGQQKARRRLLPGEDELPDPNEPSAAIGIGGPVLDFGRLGGAKLERTVKNGRGRWGWTWISEERPGLKLEVKEESKLLFPPTRKREYKIPKQSLETTTRSAYEYIAKHVNLCGHDNIPDIIAEELATTHLTRETQSCDPYQGHVLAVVHNPKARIARTTICFPMGESSHQLNVSPFLPPSNAHVSGKGRSKSAPVAKPVLRFPTEILQICASPVVSPYRLDYDATAILVRLHSSTRVVHLIPHHPYLPPSNASPVNALEVGILTSAETDGRRHMDVALDAEFWSRAAIVDECGGVWLWSEQRQEVQGRLLRTDVKTRLRGPVSTARDQFFRVAFGTRPGTIIVMSSKTLSVIDLNDPAHLETPLFSLTGQNRLFTSLEKTAFERGATNTFVCTTYEVMCIDDCRVGALLLSLRHDYGGGRKRDLEIVTVDTEAGECLLLSSRSDPLIVAYHITCVPPVRSLHPPYALPISLDKQLKPISSLGSVVLTRNTKSRRAPTLLLGLSLDGALWSTVIGPHLPWNDERYETRRLRWPKKEEKVRDLRVRWDPAVEALNRDSKQEMVVDEKARTRYREIDGRWAWLSINDEDELDPDAYFTVGELERHLRERDTPFEHIMTLADLARDVVLNEEHNVRSHLLKDLPFDQSAFDRTLSDMDQLDILPYQWVVLTLPHHPLIQRQHGHGLDSGNNAVKLFKDLQKTFPSLQNRDRVNMQRLALDLTLSRTIVFSDAIPPREQSDQAENGIETLDDDFAEAAGLLSLTDKRPPLIRFSLLAPQPPAPSEAMIATDSPTHTDVADTRLQGTTARSLMAEWVIGSDPGAFEWKSWRDSQPEAEGSSEISISRRVRPLPAPRAVQPARLHGQSDLPSGLRGTASVPGLLPQYVRSSPPPTRAGKEIDDTVEEPSSQIERGPHGGRPAGVPGKKKVKKRIGGF